MKKFISAAAALAMAMSAFSSVPNVFAEEMPSTNFDTLIFGNSDSENAHSLTEYKTLSGTDNEYSQQGKDENGYYIGGGLGDGLSYRYILPPDDEKKKDTGYLRFTLKADTAETNYITVRLSGNQYDRGNLMLYSGDGSTEVFDPRSGREYAELDCGQYSSNPPFAGRYYYATYKIPQQLVKADGTVDLKIVPTGKMDSYGTSDYKNVTQPSKFIYSVSISTEPYYVLEDNLIGSGVPTAAPVSKADNQTAYEFLKGEVEDMTDRVLSWQCYGDEWDKKKNSASAFMEGAVIRNKPVTEFDSSGTSDEIARRYTQAAILHQNWSTMSNLMILSNAYCFDFSKYKDNSEILDRYFKLLDFYEKAQDSEGGWCYHTSGEDKYAWLGADLNGSGEHGTGEWWPLMSLGADAMLQSYVQLENYVQNSGSTEAKAKWSEYMNEKIDGDLTGKYDRTRREFYIDMFAKLRDRLANPKRGEGDFYAPTNRAGTANQDFGFAYYANHIVKLLEQDTDGTINSEYSSNDDKPYLDMVKYKYGEMVDGQKWFSDLHKTGLEGGASHGGWAGDYGTLLISVTERYAESARYLPKEAADVFSAQAHDAFEAAKYYFYPALDAENHRVLSAETYASSRKDGYGVHVSYPIAGYTATRLNSNGAASFLAQYIKDERGYSGDIRNTFDTNSPHIYTSLVDSQDILKYYHEAEEMINQGKTEPLPMDDEHEDFAWFDPDAQSVVFKNNGDRCYVTFNFRRNDWEYNDYTRIHMTNTNTDRIADVRSSHQGGLYTWKDSTHTSAAGNPYTHTRYDGMNEVKYGKYIIALNMSKSDSSVGQSGTTYTMQDTTGVTKARDLVTGKIYEDNNSIKVDVAPQSAAVLEVLETTPTYKVNAVYKSGDKILGSSTSSVLPGTNVTLNAENFEGYSLAKDDTASKNVTANEDTTVIFEYDTNSKPIFTAPRREVEEADWKVFNPKGVSGNIKTDENGNITEISSTGISGETNLKKTFAYKEVTGDFKIHVTLNGFKNTVSDKDYFSIFMTDGLNFEKSNYVEYRHFSNNNNILVVDHSDTQEKSTTSHWAGDMNNKAVPIDVIIERNGNVISYEYSLDGGKTYEKTSKPSFEFNAGDVMYIGAAMTAGTEVENTAYIQNLTIDAEKVGKDINVGDTVVLDFSAADEDGDDIDFKLSDLPEGASADGSIVTFTPVRSGEYIFRAEVNDKYHQAPSVKTIKVNAAPVIRVKVNGEYVKTEFSPYIDENGRIMIDAKTISGELGCEITENPNGTFTFTKGENAVTLTPDSTKAIADDTETELDSAPVFEGSKLIIPVRFISEQLGGTVDWISSEYTATVDIKL